MARTWLRLPTKATLKVSRKGRRVTFQYMETFGTAALIASTKRLLEMLPPDVLRGLRIVTTKTSIGVAGTVDARRFGEFMCNEFSCWGNSERIAEVQSAASATLLRKMGDAAVCNPGICVGHLVAKGVGGIASTKGFTWDGRIMPLCDECESVVRTAIPVPPSAAP